MSPTAHRRWTSLGGLLALVACCGCAGVLGAAPPADTTGTAIEPMTQGRMEQIFADEVDAIVGPPGAIQTRVDGISVFLISDPALDHMRMIVPVAAIESVDRRAFGILLQANFHSTRDSRYAISDGVIYAVFMHPISSLSPELLRSSLSQVVNLAKTFGTTFSAVDVMSPAPVDPER